MRIAKEALTFDDVLLQPGFSDVLPREVDLSTQLTHEIKLNIPIMSAAMDTVTEARLAIAIAQEGGIGIVHRSMAIEQQAREVLAVKKYESGIVRNPITVTPDMTIREVIELTRSMSISGVPVVDDKQTVGIVTGRDLRFETRMDAPVSEVMTPQERLVTVGEGAGNDEVLGLLHQHRIEKVLVVGDNFELKGMITAKDFQKAKDYPQACKDDSGALRVGAAVGTGYDTDDRVAALVTAGVDVIIVDSAHGHSKGVIDRVAKIKKQYPDLQVIGGNVVTADRSGGACASRCRWCQGRRWTWLDLHNAYCSRRRRTANLGSGRSRRMLAQFEYPVDSRWWYQVLRRYCQGAGSGCVLGDAWWPVSRY